MGGTITINGAKAIDWSDRDGKIVSSMTQLRKALEGLPPDKAKKAVEDAQRQLAEQAGAEEEKLALLKDELAAIGKLIDAEAKRREITAEDARLALIAKYMPFPLATIGIPDPSAQPKPITLARTLADVRTQAAAAVLAPGDPEKFVHRWRSLGFPTFEVTTGLAAALCMTECRGILGRDFRTPFAAFAVQMPNPSPLVLADVGDVRFMLVDAHERDVMVYAGDTARSGPLPAVADDEPLEQWLRKTAAPATHQGWTQIASFIVNLCVYIDSLHGLPPPEGRQRKPGASSKKRDHEPSPPQRWVLGRAIKLSPGMLQAARAAVLGERTAKQRAAYRLHVRFMVRGHWRNQAWGAKHEARRVRWIAPFWKGPELAEGLARLYAVDAPDGPPSTGVTK